MTRTGKGFQNECANYTTQTCRSVEKVALKCFLFATNRTLLIAYGGMGYLSQRMLYEGAPTEQTELM